MDRCVLLRISIIYSHHYFIYLIVFSLLGNCLFFFLFFFTLRSFFFASSRHISLTSINPPLSFSHCCCQGRGALFRYLSPKDAEAYACVFRGMRKAHEDAGIPKKKPTLTEEQLQGRTTEEYVTERFVELSSVCKPVFRYFFLENFPEPSQWFSRRLAYTRSVATTSMVGYILGLGDRHTQNILLDNATAEVVHIDLGIAFDQGAMLPIPERVPFRLTSNMLDGMGVLGIEGTYRTSCEKALRVLRQNEEVILTILKVLAYDPLYKWTISPKKLEKLKASEHDGASSSVGKAEPQNRMAKRAIEGVQRKLRGIEGTDHLGVEGHVRTLVQQATDPVNLSHLFSGWYSWL